ncbi:MAG TPA: hypothetical protein VH640_12735 [Bryobacteraceae bacterium]|jgi:hypothetical protein
MTFRLDDLAQIAEDLRSMGIDANYEIVYCSRGCLEGLNVGDDFFPLWELSRSENEADFEACNFARIKARRGSGWSVAPPHFSHGTSM